MSAWTGLRTVIGISWRNLRRDRVALALTFVLPVVFFSIFAGIFGARGSSTPRVRLAIADLDHSDASRRLVAALAADPSLRVRTTAEVDDGKPVGPELDRAAALDLVAGGTVPVALVIPPGFGEQFGSFSGFGGAGGGAAGIDAAAGGAPTAAPGALELLADHSDPVAPQMVAGLLQKAAMTAAPDLLARSGLTQFEKYGGPLTAQQQQAVADMDRVLRPAPAAAAAGAADPARVDGLVRVEIVDVLGRQQRSGLVAFYAAGTGVMFLLFSMAGAAGVLLEEEESGALERVLVTGLGMGRLLAGKWLFNALMGVLQVTLMFVWGMAVFKIELLEHLGGFAVMTVATAAAAAAFGLVLATASRTRAQLSGLSTIVILLMSAVGGSMFPRFLMSERMQQIGLVTFNAWALDGYQKVFWYEQPTATLWPQVAVLLALTAVFLVVARWLARRWESS